MKTIGELFWGVVIIILILMVLFIDFQWTKNSIEDISGKEVSNSTVIWTMLKTWGKK